MFLRFPSQVQVLPLQLVLVQGVADGQEDPVAVKGLFQELEGAELRRFDRGLDRCPGPEIMMTSGECGLVLDLLEDVEAVHCRAS